GDHRRAGEEQRRHPAEAEAGRAAQEPRARALAEVLEPGRPAGVAAAQVDLAEADPHAQAVAAAAPPREEGAGEDEGAGQRSRRRAGPAHPCARLGRHAGILKEGAPPRSPGRPARHIRPTLAIPLAERRSKSLDPAGDAHTMPRSMAARIALAAA